MIDRTKGAILWLGIWDRVPGQLGSNSDGDLETNMFPLYCLLNNQILLSSCSGQTMLGGSVKSHDLFSLK